MNIDQLCFLGSGWPAASQCFTRSAVSASDRRGADDTMATALAVLRRWPRWNSSHSHPPDRPGLSKLLVRQAFMRLERLMIYTRCGPAHQGEPLGIKYQR